MVIRDSKALLELVRELRKEGCTRLKAGTLELEFDQRPEDKPQPTGFVFQPMTAQRVTAEVVERLKEEEADKATSPVRDVFDEPELGVPGLPNYDDDE